MLYLTIPPGLTLVALIGVAVIVWRKMSFLRKLTPESHEVGATWLHDMAPEAIDWFRSIPWHEYRRNFLVELEKLIRRGRLLISFVDRSSDKLVRKVRRGHQEADRQVQEQQEQAQIIESAKEEEEKDLEELDMDDPDQLKLKEQSLIVQIAQDPKDAQLYSELARVYMKLRNYADAVESLKAAAKLEPENEVFTRRLESAKKRLSDQQATV